MRGATQQTVFGQNVPSDATPHWTSPCPEALLALHSTRRKNCMTCHIELTPTLKLNQGPPLACSANCRRCAERHSKQHRSIYSLHKVHFIPPSLAARNGGDVQRFARAPRGAGGHTGQASLAPRTCLHLVCAVPQLHCCIQQRVCCTANFGHRLGWACVVQWAWSAMCRRGEASHSPCPLEGRPRANRHAHAWLPLAFLPTNLSAPPCRVGREPTDERARELMRAQRERFATPEVTTAPTGAPVHKRKLVAAAASPAFNCNAASCLWAALAMRRLACSLSGTADTLV